MKRKVLATLTVAVLGALSLTGCQDKEPTQTRQERNLELGIRCSEAGGAWNWSEWTGYHCEIPPKS